MTSSEIDCHSKNFNEIQKNYVSSKENGSKIPIALIIIQ